MKPNIWGRDCDLHICSYRPLQVVQKQGKIKEVGVQIQLHLERYYLLSFPLDNQPTNLCMWIRMVGLLPN